MPDGPGADPEGKLWRHLATRSTLMLGGKASAASGVLGGGSAGGCRSRSLAAFVVFSWASWVAVRAAHALLSRPSRARVTARALRAASGLLGAAFLLCGQSFHSVERSPASHLARRSRVKAATPASSTERFWGGAHRTHFGSMRSSVQALTLLKATAAAIARTSTFAQVLRARCGTWRRVGLADVKTCASEGRAWAFAGGLASGWAEVCGGWFARSAARHLGWTPRLAATVKPQTLHRVFPCCWSQSDGTWPLRAPPRWASM